MNREMSVGSGALFALLFLSTAITTLTLTGTEAQYLAVAAPIFFLTALSVLPISCWLKSNLRERAEQALPKGVPCMLFSLYAVYFFLSAAFTATEYQQFLQVELLPETPRIVLYEMVVLAATYGAWMGVRALSGAAGILFGGASVVLVLLFVLLGRQIDVLNLPRIDAFEPTDLCAAGIRFAAFLPEPALWWVLSPRVAKPKRSYFGWSVASAVLLAVSGLWMTGVLGSLAQNLPSPFYQMAGIAAFGRLERWDALCLAVWTFAVFLRVSVLIAAAAECIRPYLSEFGQKAAVGFIGGALGLLGLLLPSTADLPALRAQIQPPFSLLVSLMIPLMLCFTRRKAHA